MTARRLSRAWQVALLVSMTTWGCAGHGAPPDPDPQGEISLVVSDNHWLDMRIYLLRGETGQRLGTVPAGAAREFSLPARMLGPNRGLRLKASPIGSSESYVSAPLVVEPGQGIEWVLQSRLALSTVSVF